MRRTSYEGKLIAMDAISPKAKAEVPRAQTPPNDKQRRNPVGSTMTPEERSKILAALESANRELNFFPKKK
jgi:hypothetical protein